MENTRKDAVRNGYEQYGTVWVRAFNMCGDFATPNLYAVSQQNCLQALYTRMTVMCRRSGSSSSNDDVERAGPITPLAMIIPFMATSTQAQ